MKKSTSLKFMYTLSLLLFLRKAIHTDVRLWFILPWPPSNGDACWSIKLNLIGWNPQRTARWEPSESVCPLQALIHFLFPEGRPLISEGWCCSTELQEIDSVLWLKSIYANGERAGAQSECPRIFYKAVRKYVSVGSVAHNYENWEVVLKCVGVGFS